MVHVALIQMKDIIQPVVIQMAMIVHLVIVAVEVIETIREKIVKEDHIHVIGMIGEKNEEEAAEIKNRKLYYLLMM